MLILLKEDRKPFSDGRNEKKHAVHANIPFYVDPQAESSAKSASQ